ncbi:MAG TPA: TonB-dependent receptor [Rhodocyclaceae bacterium]|nr:TonB-dependent receptor [Rhodocyclaceae bacterium]
MSSRFPLWGGALASALVVAVPGVACAAVPNAGNIPALIQDALGRPVIGADVQLQNAAGETLGTARSDNAGRVVFSNIPAGSYALVVKKAGFQSSTGIVLLSADTASKTTTVVLASAAALDVTVQTQAPVASRQKIAAQIGASSYGFSKDDIAALPQGDATPMNQVLLQAPGVVNDSYGQIHIRGDHANIQYRVNGIELPDGISGFGQAFDTRFAQNINLLTGALPAQYGLHTAGVVDITTRNDYDGGRIDMLAGSNNTVNPSIEYGKTDGPLSYFFNASYLSNNVGIENPTSSTTPLHDNTKQARAFGYLSYLIDPATKVSFMFGTYSGQFQIPNNPGQTPDPNGLGIMSQLGLTGFNSANLNDQQHESNSFAVLALQGSLSDAFDYQASLFTRYSNFHYEPDVIGNLVFNGVASDIYRSSVSNGLQLDGTYRMTPTHTLRMGLYGNVENVISDNTSTVFPTDAGGLVSGAPFSIADNQSRNGNTTIGVYLQDEWKVLDNLTLNYGGRFDSVHAYVDEEQFSPRINAVYQWSKQTTWHVGYSRYFTPPPTELVSTSDLALFQNTTNAASGQNSPVKAERDDYYDLGVDHQLTSKLSVGADAYFKHSQNTIDEGQFGPALLLTPFNYAEGRIYGMELTANYKSDNFSAYANVARNVSKARNIVSGQYLFEQDELAYAASNWVNVDHEQAVTASLGAAYLWQGTQFSGNVTYQSGLRDGFANTGSLPSYTLVNLGATHKVDFDGTGPVELRLTVNNLLDKVYEIRDGSGIGVFAPQYGMHRSILVGVSKYF